VVGKADALSRLTPPHPAPQGPCEPSSGSLCPYPDATNTRNTFERSLVTLKFTHFSKNQAASKRHKNKEALPPRKQKKYFAEHKTELELFKSANSYLNKHRNAEGKIPVAAWVKERDKLIAEKNEISKSTMSLMERLRESDRIRKMARELTPKQPRRDRGWEMEH